MRLKFKKKQQPAKLSFFKPVKLHTKQSARKVKLKNLTWSQASIRFPHLKAFEDQDRDGILNAWDCHPFDKKRHMAFKQNDGGRCKAGFKGDTGDCFTRAYAITEGKDYKEAYDELQEKFKKLTPLKGKSIRGSGISNARTGVYKEHADQILKDKGYTWVVTSGIGKGFQMHVKEGELPKGKNILRVSKHFIASEDDDWKDDYDSSRNETRGVYGYWKKEKNEQDTAEEVNIEPIEIKDELKEDL